MRFRQDECNVSTKKYGSANKDVFVHATKDHVGAKIIESAA